MKINLPPNRSPQDHMIHEQGDKGLCVSRTQRMTKESTCTCDLYFIVQ